MDLVAKTHEALSAESSPTLFRASSLHHSSSNEPSFPIIAIAIIGILATAFLLVSYYVFVIKCCLNWHRIDLLRRFSLSRSARSHDGESLVLHSPGHLETRGLDESVIRSIPIFHFRKDIRSVGGDRNRTITPALLLSECAVCLNEFEESEKLRMIPNCCHVFHIDCIDVWLQNNANCPLCRTSVSVSSAAAVNSNSTLVLGLQIDQHIVAPSSSPIDPSPYAGSLAGGDEDYVVIELTSNDGANYQPDQAQAATRNDRLITTEGILEHWSRADSAKKVRKFQKGTSMGDECINITREKDEQFSVQPIRRSFSMDSSADRKMFMAIQEALRQHNQYNTNNINYNYEIISPISNVEGSCSGNRSVRRSFFSFGHGSRGSSRSAVLPVYLEP